MVKMAKHLEGVAKRMRRHDLKKRILTTRGHFEGPRGSLKGSRVLLKGPRDPLKRIPGSFKGPRGLLKDPGVL